MAIAITHTKVNAIADWTQSKLDEYINAGLYPQGTRIQDITQPSDWNDDHSSQDLDWLEDSVRGGVIIDMDGGDYTMTNDEARSPVKVILNSGSGTNVLTIPASADATSPAAQVFICTFAGNDFYLRSESADDQILITSQDSELVSYIPGYVPNSVCSSLPIVSALKLAAGTSNTQPIEIAPGTLLTAAEAGSIEYDGRAFYTTPVTSARGVSPSVMFAIVPAGGFALSTSAGVQSCFPSGTDVWTLAGSTTYEFEGFYHIQKAVNSVTVGMAFALGGGASVTSIKYYVVGQNNAVNVATTAQQSCYVDTVASTVVNATGTSHTVHQFKGLIRMNAGGTVTPQIDFSGTAAGTPTMMQDSYIKFTPLGTNTVASVGNVA